MDIKLGIACVQFFDSLDVIGDPRFTDMKTRQYSLKVILLGDSGVGKSTMMETYCKSQAETSLMKGHWYRLPSPMMEDKTIVRGKDTVNLRIMDTGGQERYRSVTASYFRHAHGCLLIFDLSNIQSMKNIQIWLNDLKQYNADADSMSLVLVGTLFKIKPRDVTYEQGVAFADHLGIPYVEILSRDKDQIGAIFELIADCALEKIKARMAAISTQNRYQQDRNLHKVYNKARESFLTCQC